MKWKVDMDAHGWATVTVEADTADEAEAKALMDQPGFIVEGGEVSWTVENVAEVEGGEGA